MNDSILGLYHTNTSWLYTKLYENSLFFFDYWSLVHIWSGMILILLLTSFGLKRRWVVLFTLLVIYEFLEIAFLYFALDIFRPETFKDQGTDILIGMLGGFICSKLMFKKKFLIILSAFTLAFVWVGNYQYHYNVEWLNTPGLNLWAFFLWWGGGCLIIALFLAIKKRIENTFLQFITFWLTYMAFLLVIEYVGFNLMQINEVSFPYDNPLILGLIHGSLGLHIYYMVCPFLILALHGILTRLTLRAQAVILYLK